VGWAQKAPATTIYRIITTRVQYTSHQALNNNQFFILIKVDLAGRSEMLFSCCIKV